MQGKEGSIRKADGAEGTEEQIVGRTKRKGDCGFPASNSCCELSASGPSCDRPRADGCQDYCGGGGS